MALVGCALLSAPVNLESTRELGETNSHCTNRAILTQHLCLPNVSSHGLLTARTFVCAYLGHREGDPRRRQQPYHTADTRMIGWVHRTAPVLIFRHSGHTHTGRVWLCFLLLNISGAVVPQRRRLNTSCWSRDPFGVFGLASIVTFYQRCPRMVKASDRDFAAPGNHDFCKSIRHCNALLH